MKKFVCLMMALAMVFSLSVTAGAAAIDLENPASTGNVTITVTAGAEAGKVYSVDVKWETLTFTYREADAKKWNPTNHQYDLNGQLPTAEWTSLTTINNAVVVTNHSNDAVTVKVGFDNGENLTKSGTGANADVTLTLAITSGDNELNAGVEGNYSGADKVAYKLSVEGTPGRTEDVFATITVKIETPAP